MEPSRHGNGLHLIDNLSLFDIETTGIYDRSQVNVQLNDSREVRMDRRRFGALIAIALSAVSVSGQTPKAPLRYLRTDLGAMQVEAVLSQIEWGDLS